jgi:hypothetical protein
MFLLVDEPKTRLYRGMENFFSREERGKKKSMVAFENSFEADQ